VCAVVVLSEVEEPVRLLEREVASKPWGVGEGEGVVTIKYKCKLYPATAYGGLQVLRRYSCTLSLTLVLQGWEVSARSRPRYRQE
jgi:hypothetical protein